MSKLLRKNRIDKLVRIAYNIIRKQRIFFNEPYNEGFYEVKR